MSAWEKNSREEVSGRMEEAVQKVILKRFEKPDEVRTFEKGKFELVRIGGMTIGRATYEPGWDKGASLNQAIYQRSTQEARMRKSFSCVAEHNRNQFLAAAKPALRGLSAAKESKWLAQRKARIRLCGTDTPVCA
jgi:hypothetical protein